MKIGIIQGRLSPPTCGHQTTPDDWHREFQIVENLGMTHIEWNIDDNKLLQNPIISEDIDNKIIKNISSVCFDNLVTEKIYDDKFFNENFLNIVDILNKKNIQSVTIPLVESSSIRDKRSLCFLKKNIEKTINQYPNIKINIESDSDVLYVKEILKIDNRIRFTYDTGNITASNFCHNMYIDAVFDKIDNIHLKDRKKNFGPSLPDFTGDTDFENIFNILSCNDYENIFTLQMARDQHGFEQNTIKKYLSFFRSLYEKYF